jgi:hypothetical protein
MLIFILSDFEKMSVDISLVCYQNGQCVSQERQEMISQDLLFCPKNTFFNLTVLDLANEAESFEFMTSIPVQELLNEMWVERLLPYASKIKV